MAVAVENPVTDISVGGTSVLGPFPTVFTYEFADEVFASLIDADDEATALEAGAEFTLVGLTPLTDGGAVTLDADLLDGTWPTGTVLRLERRTSIEQPVSLGDVEGLTPAVISRMFDRQCRILQEVRAGGVAGSALDGGAGSAAVPLYRDENLADVPNKATARSNLGIAAMLAGYLLAANNLSELTDVDAAVANLGGPFGDMRLADNLAYLPNLATARANLQAAKLDLSNVTLASLRDKAFRVTGGGTRDRTLGTVLALRADVNDYVDSGDTSFDGAIARCLAAHDVAVFPGGTNALGGTWYNTVGPIALADGQVLRGDGKGISEIRCANGGGAVVQIGTRIAFFALMGLSLTHAAPASGDHGVSMGTGTNDWVNDGFVDDVAVSGCDIGWSLGKCFFALLYDAEASGCLSDGFRFTTDGNATGFAMTAVGGPLQWVLVNPGSGSNGGHGFAYQVTGTAFGGAGVGSSLGTLYNPTTFANASHGISAIGSAAHPLNSLRILGGFVGEDGGHGIYLDTYARDHVVTPDFCELAGQDNIHITANNANVSVQVKQCGGANWDGVYSAAENLVLTGGNFVNNGRAGTGVDNFAGINIAGGTATLSGFTSGNFNSSIQQYGVRTGVDTLVVSGARLPDVGETGSAAGNVNGLTLSVVAIGNAVSPIFWGAGPTDSVVSGCWPASVNTGGSVGTGSLHLTGNLIVDGDTKTGTLHVDTASALAGSSNVTGSLAVSAGITALDVEVTRSLGVGTSASGVSGRISGSSLVGFTFSSLSVSGALSSGSFSTGTISAGGITATSVASSGAVSGTTITSSVDLVANGQFHGNGSSAFTASLNVTGSLAVSAGISTANAAISVSLAVGTTASGVTGRVDASDFVKSGTSINAP